MQADVSSANTVGYSGYAVNAGRFYMVGVQFSDCGVAAETADFNTFFKTTCAPGAYGDGGDSTYGNAPMIQVLKPNGTGYYYYYYLSDGDDGLMSYNLTGWCDELGNLVNDTQVGVGAAFWIKSETAGTFIFSL